MFLPRARTRIRSEGGDRCLVLATGRRRAGLVVVPLRCRQLAVAEDLGGDVHLLRGVTRDRGRRTIPKQMRVHRCAKCMPGTLDNALVEPLGRQWPALGGCPQMCVSCSAREAGAVSVQLSIEGPLQAAGDRLLDQPALLRLPGLEPQPPGLVDFM